MPPLIARGVAKSVQGARKSPTSRQSKISNKIPGEFNEARGIQNTRSTTAQSRFERQAFDRLTSTQLLADTQKNSKSTIEKSGAQGFEDTELSSYGIEERALTQKKAQLNAKKKVLAKNVKKIGGLGLSIAYVSYGWQFFFAILSLIGFASGGALKASFWTSWIDVFADFSGGLEMVGFAFWGISTLIVIMTFLAFYLWFKFFGIDPFHSVMSTFITILALTLSILPVTNLFPCILLWVAYISLPSLSSSA